MQGWVKKISSVDDLLPRVDLMVWTIKRTDTFPETFAQARFDKKVIHEHVFSFLVPSRHDV
jgi:hypothetical protein